MQVGETMGIFQAAANSPTLTHTPLHEAPMMPSRSSASDHESTATLKPIKQHTACHIIVHLTVPGVCVVFPQAPSFRKL